MYIGTSRVQGQELCLCESQKATLMKSKYICTKRNQCPKKNPVKLLIIEVVLSNLSLNS